MAFYSLALRVYYFLIRISFFWNSKAKAWMIGRNNIDADLANYNYSDEKSIWFHCASLGEFEQGKPLLELIKKKHPEYRIILTFFSPSGYQIQKNYSLADLVTYLPRDYKEDIDHFIKTINPKLVVIVKYEFWLNLFQRLDNKGIPRVLISSRFVKGKYPMNIFGKYTIPLLKKMKYIFVQDEQSKEQLIANQFNNVILAGDTRIDRVLQIADQDISLPDAIIKFVRDKKVLVCGSTWIEDELLIANLVKDLPSDWCVIIAPHEINRPHINKLQSVFENANLLSEIKDQRIKNNVLIVDSIGLLSRIYSLGAMAYVGGGFKTGLHNILEPAAFGLPIIFGPKYQRFNEAIDLVAMEGAFSISNIIELKSNFVNLCLESNRLKAKSVIKSYLDSQKGSTMIIYKELEKIIDS